jgi:hypothetical protein
MITELPLRQRALMLHSSHRKIAQEVIWRLGAPSSRAEMSMLMEGVIAPDVEEVPRHHYDNSHLTNPELQQARSYFLRDDLPNAYYHLGRALHYIQDSYVACPPFLPYGRRYNNFDKELKRQGDMHGNREQSIDNSYFESSISNIGSLVQRKCDNEFVRTKCDRIVQELSRDIQGRPETFRIADLNRGDDFHPWRGPWPPPFVDFNLGFLASYVAAKSVLSPKCCPSLDIQIQGLLTSYENQLRSTERAWSDDIIVSIQNRNQLFERIDPNKGFVAKIKNWLTGRKIRSADKALFSKKGYYQSGSHLEEVRHRYYGEVERIKAQNEGWYIFQIPALNTQAIPRQLLDINTVTKTLGVDYGKMKKMVSDYHHSTYLIGDWEFLDRSNLDGLLLITPVNGFSKYP